MKCVENCIRQRVCASLPVGRFGLRHILPSLSRKQNVAYPRNVIWNSEPSLQRKWYIDSNSIYVNMVNKTKTPKIYDGYPVWLIILANILILAVYVSSAYILFALSLITGILYVAYLVLLELYFLKEGCIHCCYYGNLCAFGKGAVAAMFFKAGDPKKFCERELGF